MSGDGEPGGGHRGSAWRSLRTVVRLTRLENHLTFAQLVFGYVLAKQFPLTSAEYLTLAEALAILAVLLYSGIYVLNDVFDAEADAQNSIKRTRPIPAEEMTRTRAQGIALLLIVLGVGAALFVDRQKLFPLALAFLAANLFYTVIAKHIRVLDILTNALTHPLRLYAGFLLAGAFPSFRLLAIWYLGAINIALFRRVKELLQGDTAGRTVLRSYTVPSLMRVYWLTLPLIAVLSVSNDWVAQASGIGWILYTLVVVGGSFKTPLIRRTVEFMWR